ncbi:MAG: hypothetical protein K5872_03930 [Rhizobiaceae bacterium]|nr:hypothetical protein [Rhizobiaceae bacterium]MCV0405360.1 hypothetical protein [Rhizobiaceae bacterium]
MTAAGARIAGSFILTASLLGVASGAATESEYWSIDDFPSDQAPVFEDYPARWPVPYGLFSINFDSHPDAPRFAEALEAAIGQGPNFATYYSVVEVGCGSGCATFVAADVDTGNVVIGPVATAGFEYQALSSLLVANPPNNLAYAYPGNEIPKSVYPRYYRLTEDGFELVWCWRPDADSEGDTAC